MNWKSKLMSLLVLAFTSTQLMAQTGLPKWAFPGTVNNNANSSQVLDVSSSTLASLPIGPTSIDYQGDIPTKSFVNFVDDAGKLLFFMVDDRIFDDEGYLLGIGNHITWETGPIQSANSQKTLMGSDISVINVPGECDKYYIVFYHETSQPIGGGNYSRGFYYLTLDLGAPNIFHTSRTGSLTADHIESLLAPVDS